MTLDEQRLIAREAHILRAGAGGNPVARYVAANLIKMIGGEAATGRAHANPLCAECAKVGAIPR